MEKLRNKTTGEYVQIVYEGPPFPPRPDWEWEIRFKGADGKVNRSNAHDFNRDHEVEREKKGRP